MQSNVSAKRPLLFVAGIGFIVLSICCLLNSSNAMIRGAAPAIMSDWVELLYVYCLISFAVFVLYIVFGILAVTQANTPKPGTKYLVAGIVFVLVNLAKAFFGYGIWYFLLPRFIRDEMAIFIPSIVLSIFFIIGGSKKTPVTTYGSRPDASCVAE